MLVEECRNLAGEGGGGGGAKLARIVRDFDNKENLAQAVRQITGNLGRLQGMRAAGGGNGADATAIITHGPQPE